MHNWTLDMTNYCCFQALKKRTWVDIDHKDRRRTEMQLEQGYIPDQNF